MVLLAQTHTCIRIPHSILIRFDWSLWTFTRIKLETWSETRWNASNIPNAWGLLCGGCCCCSLVPWLISVQDMWCVLLLLLLPRLLLLLLNMSILCMGRSPSALFDEFWWHFVFSRDFLFRCFTLRVCVCMCVCIWMPADDYIDWWRICYELLGIENQFSIRVSLNSFHSFTHLWLSFCPSLCLLLINFIWILLPDFAPATVNKIEKNAWFLSAIKNFSAHREHM